MATVDVGPPAREGRVRPAEEAEAEEAEAEAEAEEAEAEADVEVTLGYMRSPIRVTLPSHSSESHI